MNQSLILFAQFVCIKISARDGIWVRGFFFFKSNTEKTQYTIYKGVPFRVILKTKFLRFFDVNTSEMVLKKKQEKSIFNIF